MIQGVKTLSPSKKIPIETKDGLRTKIDRNLSPKEKLQNPRYEEGRSINMPEMGTTKESSHSPKKLTTETFKKRDWEPKNNGSSL